jgi:dUTP pyrophosphatase|tara:strand:- start:300 stop:758 length:459 start_codon:yes stop_codon:yes gene_type:complete
MSPSLNIDIEILDHSSDLPIPRYQTEGAAGMDLYAALSKPIILRPLERTLIPTGLKISLPKNLEAQIRPRSGLAYTNGISILNSPGTIDSDYRGEIKILLINLGQDKFVIEHGSRIAQLIIAPIIKAKLKVVLALNKTKRGHRGFGSTGQKA